MFKTLALSIPQIRRLYKNRNDLLIRVSELERDLRNLQESPIDSKLNLNEPLTQSELRGAYKALSFLRPDEKSLRLIEDANEKMQWFPHGLFLNLIQLPEVQETLALPLLQKYSNPFPFKTQNGFTHYGYAWDHFVSLVAMRSKEYEPHIQNILRKYTIPGSIAIDVGANIGIHSALLCSLVGRDGIVYAFEPLNHIYNLLERMKEANNFDQLVLYNVALSGEAGEVYMKEDLVNLGGGSVVDSEPNDDAVSVPAMVLDDIVKDVEREVSVIKIDVEGHEGSVLDGSWKTIETFSPTVIMEFGPENLRSRGVDPVELLSRFQHLGYKVRNSYDLDVINNIGSFSQILCDKKTFTDVLLTPG